MDEIFNNFIHIKCKGCAEIAIPLYVGMKNERLFEFFSIRENTVYAKNNEMAKVKGAVVVNDARCKGCNLCVVACPCDVLELHAKEVNHKGYHYVYVKNPEECIGCANCGYVCPDACLTIYKEKKK